MILLLQIVVYTNILNERSIIKKKGFPQSYDFTSLVKCISNIKSGVKIVTTPVYYHVTYDIVQGKQQVIKQPNIIILEGVNILQSGMSYQHHSHHVLVSDLLNLLIYIDAPENLLKTWYVSRFMNICHKSFLLPQSAFYHYSTLA